MLVHSPLHITEMFHPRKELANLLWSGASRRVALTLLGLFSSIYIYQIALDSGMGHVEAISAIISFHLILRISKFLTLLFSEDLSRKIGFVKIIKLSILPFAAHLFAFLSGDGAFYMFYIAALFWGIHAGFYWWGFHGYFVKTQDKKHFGRDISEIQLLRTVAVVLTPVMGGIFVSIFGFPSVFILAGLFMLFAVLAFKSKEEISQKTDTGFKEVLSLLGRNKSTSLAYAGLAAEGVIYSIAWPLFLYFVFGEVLSLGVIVSLAALMVAAVNVCVGDWVDKQGERGILFFGTIVNTLSWIIRIFGVSVTTFVLADTARNFGQKSSNLTLTELTYKKAIKKYSARAILFRETALIAGGLISLLVMFLITRFGGGIETTFIVAGFAAVLPLISILSKKI